MNRIGDSIKRLRSQNSMSQEMLAEKLNVSRQAVSNWENGKTQPDAETLTRLSTVFKVTVDEIIHDKIPVRNDESKSKAIFLPVISMAISLLHFIMALAGFLNPAGVMVSVMLASVVSLIMYFAFESSIRNRDFAMLAGHKKASEKDLSRYEKQLRAMSGMVSWLALLLNIIYSLMYRTTAIRQMPLSMVFLGVFLLTVASIIFIVNFKYRDK